MNSCTLALINADSNNVNLCGAVNIGMSSTSFSGIEYPGIVGGLSGSGYP
jgi:hypothetical protein